MLSLGNRSRVITGKIGAATEEIGTANYNCHSGRSVLSGSHAQTCSNRGARFGPSHHPAGGTTDRMFSSWKTTGGFTSVFYRRMGRVIASRFTGLA